MSEMFLFVRKSFNVDHNICQFVKIKRRDEKRKEIDTEHDLNGRWSRKKKKKRKELEIFSYFQWRNTTKSLHTIFVYTKINQKLFPCFVFVSFGHDTNNQTWFNK